MELFLFSVMLGVGLAMDACAVSIANFLSEPKMTKKKMVLMPTVFGIFQFAMPIIGYFCGFALSFLIKNILPFLSFAILCFLGTKMIISAIKEKKGPQTENEIKHKKLTMKALFVQAVATSLDALSVGFVISYLSIFRAIICSLVIGFVTFLMAFFAISICKKFDKKFGANSNIIGGIILILIGIEILIKAFI